MQSVASWLTLATRTTRSGTSTSAIGTELVPFPRHLLSVSAGLCFAQENPGTSENANDWMAECVSAIEDGTFSGLNNSQSVTCLCTTPRPGGVHPGFECEPGRCWHIAQDQLRQPG